jgi:prepilin-type N-terminal cleavage/methylation domain-containing protein
MSRRRGFTLVEVLLAVALLTVLATAAVSWAVTQRRSGAAIEERYERLRHLLACQQALREDLRLAPLTLARPRPDESGVLVFRTLRHLPDETPAQREVTWRYDAARRALVRSTTGESGERIRIAVGELDAARFIQQERRGLVLEVRPPHGAPLSLVIGGGP